MKSEHRHELKTNELAQWLNNFPQWCKDNMNTIIAILSVIAVICIFWSWRYYSKNVVQVSHQVEFTNLIGNILNTREQVVSEQMSGTGMDKSYVLITQASDLGSFAENKASGNMAALAFIKQADAIRAEVHYSLKTISDAYLNERIEQAKAAYNKALGTSMSDKTVKALASYGLGLCAEELGNIDEAKEIYNAVLENKEFQGTVAIDKIKRRLNTMEDYTQEIVFKPAPPQPIPDPNSVLDPIMNMLNNDSNQLADVNLPLDINISDMNSTGDVIDSVLPIESDIPIEVNDSIE